MVIKKLFAKRGSVLVESAMVIPLIILISMAIIFLMMDFYTITVDEVRNDIKVFQEGFGEGEALRKARAAEELINEIK